jgi:hypothetical protein
MRQLRVDDVAAGNIGEFRGTDIVKMMVTSNVSIKIGTPRFHHHFGEQAGISQLIHCIVDGSVRNLDPRSRCFQTQPVRRNVAISVPEQKRAEPNPSPSGSQSSTFERFDYLCIGTTDELKPRPLFEYRSSRSF